MTNLVVNEIFYNHVVEHVVNNHCKEQASQSEKTDDGHEHYEYSTVLKIKKNKIDIPLPAL